MTSPAPSASPQVGERAPGLRARTQHGETVTLDDLLSGTDHARVLLVFYPWAFSGICTGELGALRAGHAELAEAGVRVVAVSCDAMFTLRAFAEAEDLPFELLSDHWPHGEIARAYGVFDEEAGCALRGSFLIDGSGTTTWSVVNGIGEARDIVEHVRTASAR
ncbi:Peroxiredoxin [Microlunatus sagamiharensis]|uniref:Peroxiredoxin n=1 Tax=Microlunatus sagamiharensis TaxID=546874 RepID=A0A1H2MFJ2_9ACTN|nr:peroxiredoxin [Microlunatus sagamiharensis]SDU92003.1 Peroxiredoxin [Microlunatus sagamiharensis]